MLSDKTFQIVFLASLITHGVILLHNPSLISRPLKNKEEQRIEVSYVKTLPGPKEAAKLASARKESFLKASPKISAEKKIPPPFIDKENIFKQGKKGAQRDLNFAKPLFVKPDIIAIRKKITLPPIGIDKIKNPSYLSYYQIVREKIRHAAYQNYTRVEEGEVYLSFVISGVGDLKEIRLIEEKSSNTTYLRDIALRSIKAASPFPRFPPELDYPQLSFNVVISFEIE